MYIGCQSHGINFGFDDLHPGRGKKSSAKKSHRAWNVPVRIARGGSVCLPAKDKEGREIMFKLELEGPEGPHEVRRATTEHIMSRR